MESNILFRASQVGNLMVEPRSKTETLSETTKTYLIEVFIKHKYGREKDITSKYFSKGIAVEEDSITLYSRLNKEFYIKNEENMRNEFVTGTPDLMNGDVVIDIKSSWDIFSFWKSKTSPLNKDYYWQLQVYMWLTGRTKAKLAYCLVNTPETLIDDEKKKYIYRSGITMEEQSTEALELIERNCKYDDIPIAERMHVVDIAYNPDDIERLKVRIDECRKYMKETFNL